MVTKQSFRHNLNFTSNQKTSLTKVVTFDIEIKNMQYKDKIMQSFGHKTVISSQSKLHIQSKTSLTKIVELLRLIFQWIINDKKIK